MSGSNVQPLRTSQVDDGTHAPILTRLITPPPGMSDEDAYAMERKVHLRLLIENIFKLSAQVARLLIEKAGPVEDFCGAVFDKDEEVKEVVVHVAPREIAIESLGDGSWGSETRERLAKPFLPDRLDVIVESHMMLVLASCEVFPAFPVTRAQAEAMNLPAQLLFAKGEAFVSVGEAQVDDATLLDACESHNELVEDSMEEIYSEAVKAMRKHDLRQCAGVVLALGPEGDAVSAVTREQSRRLVEGKPLLARKLDRAAIAGATDDGRDILSIPVIVWAKGHVSVQTRELVEGK